MTTPLKDTLALALALNDPTQPFTYEVKGNTIIGKWNIVSAKSLYPTQYKQVDKKFQVSVDLDEKKGTWKPKEKSSDSGASFNDGKISIGGSVGGFSGKSMSKGASFEFGGINK